MPERARLTPAVADTRRAVRAQLAQFAEGDLVLVACSGGPDSIALAAATYFEANAAKAKKLRVGAVIIEHGLQPATKKVAADTRDQLISIGLDPVVVVEVKVGKAGGVEAAARTARYEALAAQAELLNAKAVLLGHTLDDQAETVLLGLARGSGSKAISGMAEQNSIYLRPFLKLRRAETVAACQDQNLRVWNDPHNEDPSYARVRARRKVLPVLEAELGPGIAEALSRSADQAREDEIVLGELARQQFSSMMKISATTVSAAANELKELPLAIRHRVILQAVEVLQAPSIARTHILAIDELIDNWHGQKSLTLPGVRVERTEGEIVFKTTKTLLPGAC